ncbi:MAG: deoxyribose-phosphate aldolase [Sumerlaeia bacterium]
MEKNGIAAFIDHTILKADSTEAAVRRICAEAIEHDFASVCVNTCWVPLCAELLADSAVKVCCVVGFPLGAMSTEGKAYETADAIAKGAEEIDMVVPVGHLKSGDYAYVQRDIASVVKAAQGRPVKVILETSMLTDDEKVAACILSKAAGAAFVKTSTGFGGGGATVEDVALMRKSVGDALGVKASGGIRDAKTAHAMIAAGADRLGCSAGVQIVEGKSGGAGY